LACAAERAITFSCLLASHANTYTSRAIEAIRGRPRWLSETPSNVLRLLPTWSPTAPTLTRCGAQGQRGRRPDRALYYMYLRTRYARAAPTAMPRASCAINLATRWRFTYPLCSHTRAEIPSKDTLVYSLRLVGGTILASLATMR
jgi:hypothetical protein